MFLSTANIHLFLATSLVFIALNSLENLIHFTIGRNVQNRNKLTKWSFEIPTKTDIAKILVVMLIFAFFQGFFTCLVQGCFKRHS